MQLTVEFDRETDGRYIAEVLELPGCLVYGRTRREAEARARTCALRILADQVDRGDWDPSDVAEISFGEDRGNSRCPLGLPHVPNAETIAAMREARRGGLPRVRDVRALLAKLNADD